MDVKDPSPKTAKRTAETAARDAERKARLAAALRTNLKRRKAPAKDGGETPE